MPVVDGSQDEAVDVFHEVERRAYHLDVQAVRHRLRNWHRGSVQCGQHPVLAVHVMRGRQDVAEGRPAQHELAAIKVKPVGEVGATASDQLHSSQLTEVGNVGAGHPLRKPD